VLVPFRLYGTQTPFVNVEGGIFLRLNSVTRSTVCEAVSDEAARPLRADAQRNRQRVLDAAEAVFAAEGISVPVDVIAEKAGVGVGTLYRHFPTKEKLFEAIVIERIEQLVVDARGRLGSDDPGSAFFDFLQHMVGEVALKRDLIAALSGAGVEFEVVAAGAKQELQDAVRDLLLAAQLVGAVRQDVTGEVVLSLVGGTCMASEGHHAAVSPLNLLQIVCDGLKAPERSL
jgi:AcrR family transcriptional regulator